MSRPTKEQLDSVNASLRRTNIKGKEYIDVSQRVQAFRELYPNAVIKTELINHSDKSCLFRACVYDQVEQEGTITEVFLSCAHAFETNTGRGVNATSCVENCETSAVGRALGMLGIGSVEAIASADEVAHAQAQQSAQSNKRAAYLKAVKERECECKELGIKAAGMAGWLETYCNETDTAKLNIEQLTAYGKHLAGLIASKKELAESENA